MCYNVVIMNTTSISLRLPNDLLAEIDRQAAEDSRSRNFIIVRRLIAFSRVVTEEMTANAYYPIPPIAREAITKRSDKPLTDKHHPSCKCFSCKPPKD